MCSITNTAHPSSSSSSSSSATASSSSSLSSECCHVYLFSYLLIISWVACVSVTMKQCVSVSMCTCYPALKSALPALCRVVSVCRFAHPHSLIAWCTRFLAGKKKPLFKRLILFHKPSQGFQQVQPQDSELMG